MTAGVSGDSQQLLDAIGRAHPEWRSWLVLLEETLREADDPVWDGLGITEPPGERPPGAPELHGATLTVDERAASRWVERLLGIAGLPKEVRTEPLSILAAAVSHDDARLALLASESGADAHALGAVAQLAAMPLLQACGRWLGGRARDGWSHGYCPTCGTWPAIAELRGLESERRLRCSRCGGDWTVGSRRCPYCDTSDYRQLGSLVPEEQGEARRVDTCSNCHGYLKVATAFRAWPAGQVAIEDLATVELDLVALERGYARPSRMAYPPLVHLEAAPPKRRLLDWRP